MSSREHILSAIHIRPRPVNLEQSTVQDNVLRTLPQNSNVQQVKHGYLLRAPGSISKLARPTSLSTWSQYCSRQPCRKYPNSCHVAEPQKRRRKDIRFSDNEVMVHIKNIDIVRVAGY